MPHKRFGRQRAEEKKAEKPDLSIRTSQTLKYHLGDRLVAVVEGNGRVRDAEDLLDTLFDVRSESHEEAYKAALDLIQQVRVAALTNYATYRQSGLAKVLGDEEEEEPDNNPFGDEEEENEDL